MKAPLFFIAAITAFFVLPFDFTIMASALFGAGLAAILLADYRRSSVAVGAAASAAAKHYERFRLAA